MQPVLAVDGERVALQPLDLRPHRDQALGEIGDLGLARGIFDHRRAAGEHRRHQRILGRPDRDGGEGDGPAGKAALRRDRLHIAGGDLDLGAERLQRLEVQVDRAGADRAAAGERDRRLAGAREQRAEHEDRGAHLAHDVVGRDRRRDVGGAEGHHPADVALARPLDRGRDSELVEQVAEAVDVGEARQVPQRQRLVGQQRAGHQGQGRVLCTRNRDSAVERPAAPCPWRAGLSFMRPRASGRPRWFKLEGLDFDQHIAEFFPLNSGS